MIFIDNRYKLKYIDHMEKEFYEILGIPRSSSEKEIKQAKERRFGLPQRKETEKEIKKRGKEEKKKR